MANVVRLFFTRTHQRTLFILLWTGSFVLVVTLLAALASYQVGESMRGAANETVDHFFARRADLIHALDLLDRDVTAEPCSSEFHVQLRRIAYLPDQLNEFVYAPGGLAQCSVHVERLAAAVDLGEPDVRPPNPFGLTMWIDQSLDFLGLDGLTGTLVARGSFAAVVPPPKLPDTAPPWLSQQLVVLGEDGRWFHRLGEPGIYERMIAAGGASLFAGAFYTFICKPDVSLLCFVAEATVADLVTSGMAWVVAAFVGAALLSAWVANRLQAAINRYWSFEERVRRYLNDETIACLYQPIIALATGEVAGVEVLARWRDVDGSLVTPDKLLPVVEQQELTMPFTAMVVRRAAEELASHVPADRRLGVFFNIFPRDFDRHRLIQVLSPFDGLRDRFELTIEIVENDQVDVPTAQREIEELRSRGVRTFIDDFGSGYSNIHNLAALSVDGVKLDRAFAMSSDDSLMARLLSSVIDMIHESGRVIVVEGIETAERLETIRATGRVDYGQGFYFARPLAIGDLVAYLAEHDTAVTSKRSPPLVAVASPTMGPAMPA